MPFFEPFKNEPEYNIDYKYYAPISVLSANIDGKIIPLLFKYEEQDKSIETVKIESVHSTNIIKYGFKYCCNVITYGKLKQVNIIFYKNLIKWVLEK